MLVQFFIGRPVFAWVIACIIMIAGGLSIQRLPISQYPSVAPPSIAVSAVYPGASARVLEETVTTVIEQEMNGLTGLLYVASTSESSGAANVNLTFESGTNPDLASVEVQNRLKRVEARLPDEVRRQGLRVDKSTRNYLMFVTINSTDGSLDRIALGNYAAASLLDPIRRVPGVGEASLFGPEYAMRIWLDPAKINGYQLTVNEVVKAIQEQNIQVAAGELGGLPSKAGQQLNASITLTSRLRTAEEFGEIILKADASGATVRLKEVATIELGASDYSFYARVNGKDAAPIGIKLSPTGNALETATAIRQKMDELSKYFPAGVAYDIPYDTSTFVKISIQEVVKTLAEAIFLVFLVMLLFLQNWRATLIPTLVVPIALLGTFAGMLAFGFSINVLTLFGMVLAIGILVDDAIVVVENVERIMQEEKLPPLVATRKAMSQITNAIIGITVVLCAVFIPMAFFGGSVGAIYRQFSLSLVVSMFFSALLALTLTPALCATLLKPIDHSANNRGFAGWFNRGFNRMGNGYQSLVGKIIRRTGRYLLIYLVLLGIVGWLFSKLPSSFLPEEDQGYFITLIQLAPGTTQENTLETIKKVENYYLTQESAITKMVAIAGFSFLGSGQNAGIAFTRLKDWSERTADNLHVKAVIGRAFGFLMQLREAMAFPINPPSIPELGTASGFDFRLQDRTGKGYAKLIEARNMLLGLASKSPILQGVRPEGQEATPQLEVQIDRSKAQAFSINLADVHQTLAVTFGSAYINDFVREGRVQKVVLQATPSARMLPQDILALSVRNKEGKMVPFGSFTSTQWVTGSPRLERYNGFPAVKIAGNAAPGHSTGEAMAAMETMLGQLPPGFGFEWSGQSYEERLSGSQAPALFILSILIVFLALAALYESWSIPVSILLVVPLGILGALLAVLLRGLPNDIYFKVGLIAIIGLSSKNAILIIEFAKDLEAQGKDLFTATLEACRLRFRPILMTSMAFILGVLPLALSSGAGAASRQAIGTGVLGGMIAATILAIFWVPVFFIVIRSLLKKPLFPR